MGEHLDGFRHDSEWSPISPSGKRITYRNVGSDLDVAVLDLGMRAGLIRYLRSKANVHMIPYDDPFEEKERMYDLAIVSNGPGSVPGKGLSDIVGRFAGSMEGVPLFAMGIGALAEPDGRRADLGAR